MKACLFGILLLAFASAASAQRDLSAPPAGEASSEYRQLVQQALDEFQRGNWDEAAGLFAQAHRISPSARTLRGMGLSAFEGRRYVASLQHLRAALLSNQNPLTDSQRSEVEDTISRAEHYVAKLDLTVLPESAEVVVNGETIPNNGGERMVLLDPGLVEIRASSPGHQLALRQLRMVSGAHQHLELRLAPDGAASGSADKVDASHRASSFPYSTLGWLSVGLAGASGVGALVSWRVREGAAEDYNDEGCSQVSETDPAASKCSGLSSRVSSADTAIIVTAVAGGVFVGAAALFFVLDGTHSDTPHPEKAQACGAGPGELGVQCALRF